MAMSYIKKLSNKQLLDVVKQERAERQGRYEGYVKVKQVLGTKGFSEVKQEIERRKRAGTLSRTAGTTRKRKQAYGFGGLL